MPIFRRSEKNEDIFRVFFFARLDAFDWRKSYDQGKLFGV